MIIKNYNDFIEYFGLDYLDLKKNIFFKKMRISPD